MRRWIEALTRISHELRGEAFLVALLVILFYHPLLRFGSIQSGGDAANLFWPVKVLIQRSLWQDGVVPLWNPWSFMGTPLAASLQHAVFYPVDLLIYALFPAHIGLNIGNLFHLVLAGVGAYLWLRRGHLLGAAPSIIVGAAFPCCAWFWGQQEHINQLAAVSYLPWLAWTMWSFLHRRICVRTFASIYSLIAAFQFMTGHPQEAFYAHFFCFLLAVGKLCFDADRAALLKRLVSGGAVAGILLGLLVAVQLLPTLELNSHSRRQFKDPLYAISFSMPPEMLMTYFSPHHFGSFRDGFFLNQKNGEPVLDEAGNPAWDRRAFGEYGLFLGVPLLLLAFLGLGVEARRRWLPLGLLAIAALALLLALGGNTDPRRIFAWSFTEQPQPGWSLHEVFLRVFPPAQGFRVPARISILTTFALVTLAGFGVQAIADQLPRQRQLPAMLLLGAAIFAALYLPSRREKFHYPVSVEAIVAMMEHTSFPRTLDSRMYRLTLEDDTRLVRERHLDATFFPGNPLWRRFLIYQPHMNAMRRQPLVDGYEEGLVPTARFKDFTYAFNRNFRTSRPEQALLNVLGVSRIYSDLPIDTTVYPLQERLTENLGAIYHNPKATGAAFWVEQAEGIDFAAIDGPWWKGGAPLTGISTQRIDYGTLMNRQTNHSPLATDLPTVNSVRILGHSGGDQDAILALGWYPGWKVENGEQAEELEFLSAVHARVPWGMRGGEGVQWSLHFRPESYRIGLFLTALGIGLWVGLLQKRRGDFALIKSP